MSKESTAVQNGTTRTRTPKQYDDILRGALKLTLKERCDLISAVKTANVKEVEEKDAIAKEAKSLVNGG